MPQKVWQGDGEQKNFRVEALRQWQNARFSPLNELKAGFTSFSNYARRSSKTYAFTEQGVAMLSSVLRSKRAVQVNIAIMRAFVKLRSMVAAQKELSAKLTELERKVTDQYSFSDR